MTALVKDGRDMFGCSLDGWRTGQTGSKRHAGMLPKLAAAIGATVPPLSVVADVEPAPVRVDWGRWIADCPCGGAEMVWLEGPHQIWCARCGNADLGGQWRPVVLPERVHEIMAELEALPRLSDRNWRPAESGVM
jgi:hypothetical protein